MKMIIHGAIYDIPVWWLGKVITPCRLATILANL